MIKMATLFLAAFLTLACLTPGTTGVNVMASTGASDVVYVTQTGGRYHRASCRYAKNATPVTRQEAESRGLTPCKVCKP